MKRTLVLTMGLLLAAGLAGAQGLTGTLHDFSGATGWNTGGEMCQPCHTPHNAYTFNAASDGDVTDELAPLWNHATTGEVFTMYTSPTDTLDGTIDAAPGSVSKACLSCHDGVTALDSFGGATGSTVMTGIYVVGSDLSNDHPISIDYDTVNDTGLNATSTALGSGTVADVLFSNKVECGSCHDVHDDAGVDNFLVVANTGSTLCLACHNK